LKKTIYPDILYSCLVELSTFAYSNTLKPGKLAGVFGKKYNEDAEYNFSSSVMNDDKQFTEEKFDYNFHMWQFDFRELITIQFLDKDNIKRIRSVCSYLEMITAEKVKQLLSNKTTDNFCGELETYFKNVSKYNFIDQSLKDETVSISLGAIIISNVKEPSKTTYSVLNFWEDFSFLLSHILNIKWEEIYTNKKCSIILPENNKIFENKLIVQTHFANYQTELTQAYRAMMAYFKTYSKTKPDNLDIMNKLTLQYNAGLMKKVVFDYLIDTSVVAFENDDTTPRSEFFYTPRGDRSPTPGLNQDLENQQFLKDLDEARQQLEILSIKTPSVRKTKDKWAMVKLQKEDATFKFNKLKQDLMELYKQESVKKDKRERDLALLKEDANATKDVQLMTHHNEQQNKYFQELEKIVKRENELEKAQLMANLRAVAAAAGLGDAASSPKLPSPVKSDEGMPVRSVLKQQKHVPVQQPNQVNDAAKLTPVHQVPVAPILNQVNDAVAVDTLVPAGQVPAAPDQPILNQANDDDGQKSWAEVMHNLLMEYSAHQESITENDDNDEERSWWWNDGGKISKKKNNKNKKSKRQ